MTTKSLIFMVVQLVLFLIFALLPTGYAASFAWQCLSFLFVIFGSIITLTAIFKLGPGLTPLPDPRQRGKLVTTGIYKWIRHPIYSGMLLIVSGISIYSFHFPRATIVCLLLLLFYYKSDYEESMLEIKFPDYRKYKLITGRFFPKLFKIKLNENK